MVGEDEEDGSVHLILVFFEKANDTCHIHLFRKSGQTQKWCVLDTCEKCFFCIRLRVRLECIKRFAYKLGEKYVLSQINTSFRVSMSLMA